MDISMVVTAIGLLVAVTNIIVEVIKKISYDKIPTNILVVIVAEIMTIVSGIAYIQIKNIETDWYIYPALVIGGILVSYAAMFGFDKLKEAFSKKNGDVNE